MIKQITYLELLQMVKEGTQPKEIEHNNMKFVYESGSYLRETNRWCSLLDYIGGSTEYEFVNDKEISYEESILDEKEKEYLKAVIKPFRDRVEWISKGRSTSSDYPFEKLMFNTARVVGSYYDTLTLLPPFPSGTMYKGMELDKVYTLEDLGL